MKGSNEVTLVTGGNGFIGCHLVQLLRERGERVRVLDIRRASNFLEGVEYLQGSVVDKSIVSLAMRGVQRVYHLAANPKLWDVDKRNFAKTNVLGTKTVLRAAQAASVQRLVYTSTESILKSYRNHNKGLIDETCCLDLEDMPGPYCRSKFLAEQAALEATDSGLDVVVVNPTLPVGPGDHMLTPPTNMFLDFLGGRNLPAYLECQLNMIDVRDVATGHVLAMDRGHKGERYILGNENLSLSRLLKLLEDLSGMKMPSLSIPYALAWCTAVVSEFVSDYITKKPPKAPITGVRLARTPMIFDNTKAVEVLGLRVRPIEESLRDMLVWFEDVGLLILKNKALRNGCLRQSLSHSEDVLMVERK